MTNEEKINAVNANLETVLIAPPLSFAFEDTKNDPELKTITLVQLHLLEIDYEETSGQRKAEFDVTYELIVEFKQPVLKSARMAIAKIATDMREAITVGSLNVGDLASSKSVVSTQHTGVKLIYSEKGHIKISYPLVVRIFET